ncbi:MAG: DsrE family protein [Proteobacteria bacterium]|nr:DsrE family protein [Pseudomonadota bacterium]
MKKVAIVTHMEHASPADRGRMAHALHLARDLKDGGAEVKLVFGGKSVDWLAQLTNPERDKEHPFVRAYGNVFDAVRDHAEACNFCCIRFDATESVQAAGIPIRGEGKDHMNLAAYVLDGWELITF